MGSLANLGKKYLILFNFICFVAGLGFVGLGAAATNTAQVIRYLKFAFEQATGEQPPEAVIKVIHLAAKQGQAAPFFFYVMSKILKFLRP